MLVASAQLATGLCTALVSLNTSAGIDPVAAAGAVLTRFRLFDSPVKLRRSQPGPLVTPLLTALRTTSVVPLAKTAWSELPSPKTLNSTSCHRLPMSGKELLPFAVNGCPFDTVTAISSVVAPLAPAAEPVSFRLGSGGVGVARGGGAG